MRTPPGPIPTTLPSISQVIKKLHETVHRPITRLADSSLFSLTECFNHGDVWLTGSSVWLQAVFNMPPDLNGDFDLVFSNRDNCYGFLEIAMEKLNSRIGKTDKKDGFTFFTPGGFTVVTNKLGGSRITHPDGRGVIDIWHLENESIAECVAAFPGGDHVKCAYEISQYPRTANLTRVVRIPSLKRNSSYPGTEEYTVTSKVVVSTGKAKTYPSNKTSSLYNSYNPLISTTWGIKDIL